MLDVFDEHRYRRKRTFSRILNFVWSVILGIVVIAVAAVVLNACWPWFTTLWKTIAS